MSIQSKSVLGLFLPFLGAVISISASGADLTVQYQCSKTLLSVTGSPVAKLSVLATVDQKAKTMSMKAWINGTNGTSGEYDSKKYGEIGKIKLGDAEDGTTYISASFYEEGEGSIFDLAFNFDSAYPSLSGKAVGFHLYTRDPDFKGALGMQTPVSSVSGATFDDRILIDSFGARDCIKI